MSFVNQLAGRVDRQDETIESLQETNRVLQIHSTSLENKVDSQKEELEYQNGEIKYLNCVTMKLRNSLVEEKAGRQVAEKAMGKLTALLSQQRAVNRRRRERKIYLKRSGVGCHFD